MELVLGIHLQYAHDSTCCVRSFEPYACRRSNGFLKYLGHSELIEVKEIRMIIFDFIDSG
jgi:hypothetical protein